MVADLKRVQTLTKVKNYWSRGLNPEGLGVVPPFPVVSSLCVWSINTEGSLVLLIYFLLLYILFHFP